MKTLLHLILTVSAAVGALAGGYWTAAVLSAPAAPPPAFVVPMQVHQSPSKDGTLALDEDARESVSKAISRYGRIIANAEIYLDEAQHPATFHDSEAREQIRFSLKLTLDDGTRLSTKLRHAERHLLPRSIRESVRRCMQRYHLLEEQGRTAQGISNI